MLRFKNEWHYRSGNLQKCIFLIYLSPNDNENLAGLVKFDFIILWRNMITKSGYKPLNPEKLLWNKNRKQQTDK